MGFKLNRPYKRLDSQVRCDCGAAATHQVMITQLRVSDTGRRRTLVEVQVNMPLCESCYRLHIEIEGERGVLVR
jgi:hypothetical protein